MCIRDSVDILMIGGKANEQQSQRMMKDRLRFKEYIRIHYFEYPGLCSMPQISKQENQNQGHEEIEVTFINERASLYINQPHPNRVCDKWEIHPEQSSLFQINKLPQYEHICHSDQQINNEGSSKQECWSTDKLIQNHL
eukprot:TRINITY_DN13228_c0_g1_i2.p1 TRINITY_DN13228_c0_g1~~TRINITY_DN13228_c0_g1_i2.p1  ORF type:complete len:139 (-),score=6.81 TRINITY_DN13228_c0_g1_i2:587-1003(-)